MTLFFFSLIMHVVTCNSMTLCGVDVARFFCKFHSRRMQELTEAGLENFSLLFLCLALAVEPQELVSCSTNCCNCGGSRKFPFQDLNFTCSSQL